jgi:hypothetical protein
MGKKRQAEADIVLETLLNQSISFTITFGVQQGAAALWDYPAAASHSLIISSVLMVLSIIRNYLVRRAFNGRKVWKRINKVFRS